MIENLRMDAGELQSIIDDGTRGREILQEEGNCYVEHMKRKVNYYKEGTWQKMDKEKGLSNSVEKDINSSLAYSPRTVNLFTSVAMLMNIKVCGLKARMWHAVRMPL